MLDTLTRQAPLLTTPPHGATTRGRDPDERRDHRHDEDVLGTPREGVALVPRPTSQMTHELARRHSSGVVAVADDDDISRGDVVRGPVLEGEIGLREPIDSQTCYAWLGRAHGYLLVISLLFLTYHA